MKRKVSKTKYCIHYQHCDREEDCFNGEPCPVEKFNPECGSQISSGESDNEPHPNINEDDGREER